MINLIADLVLISTMVAYVSERIVKKDYRCIHLVCIMIFAGLLSLVNEFQCGLVFPQIILKLGILGIFIKHWRETKEKN